MATNHHPNHLHGGERGFDKVVWDARAEETSPGPSVVLSYLSKDGEEGYPGNLKISVRYTLSSDDSLIIEYQASSDSATPVNFTHHGYFNLSGNHGYDVLGHEMEINADHYTPVNPVLIPTGEIAPVDGTPFDFRSPRPIGSRINEMHKQRQGHGGPNRPQFPSTILRPGETFGSRTVYSFSVL